MDYNENNLPPEYRPLSAWEYFGYTWLFTVPLIGFIFLLIFAFDKSNINRRNFARSYFCSLVIAAIISGVIIALSSAGIIASGLMQ